MRVQIQKTRYTTPNEITRKWFVVDAQGKTLGRIASAIVPYLSGKNKPQYVPNLDTGDFVIVINASKLRVTGKRLDQKFYYRYSGYPSGLRSTALRDMLQRHPDRVLKIAVRGMLPKGVLGREMLGKLKIYADGQHPHEAQKPVVLEL